jgi:hypothetical protein
MASLRASRVLMPARPEPRPPHADATVETRAERALWRGLATSPSGRPKVSTCFDHSLELHGRTGNLEVVNVFKSQPTVVDVQLL